MLGIGSLEGTATVKFDAKTSQYTLEQITQMSNMALQQPELDLLPDKLARVIDQLVLESLKAAEEVVQGKLQTKQAQMPVS